MRAVRYDLVIEKGAKLSRVFRWKDSAGVPRNVTGWEARFTVRSPTVDDGIVYDELSTVSGSALTVGTDDGEFTLLLDALLTTESPDGECRGWYTLKSWPPGEPELAVRLAEGYVTWFNESTRDDAS